MEPRYRRVSVLREYWEMGDIAACNVLLRTFVRYVDLRADGIEIGYMVEIGATDEPRTGPGEETGKARTW